MLLLLPLKPLEYKGKCFKIFQNLLTNMYTFLMSVLYIEYIEFVLRMYIARDLNCEEIHIITSAKEKTRTKKYFLLPMNCL